jgi:hypothetical protein
MSYATGTVANPAALQTVIENFATTNGWTLNAGAGSWLSKGGSSVNLMYGIPKPINSITSSGTATATVTLIGHGLTTGNLVSIFGATNSLYNVTNATVTFINSSSFSYPLASIPSGAAATATNSNLLFISNNLASSEVFSIAGSNSSTGTGKCPYPKAIYIPSASWPVTYYIFSNTLPDMISVVLQYATNYIEVIHFGDIVKIHNSAYVGGNWFHAPRYCITAAAGQSSKLWTFTDAILSSSTTNSIGNNQDYAPIPFSEQASTGRSPNGLHIEIDSLVWDTLGTGYSARNGFSYTDYTNSLLFRSPNTWNNQANLVPMHLQLRTSASTPNSHYLGYIEHLRLIRVDNYAIGDEITIGSDVWKVFPWIFKNSSIRNGDGSDSTVPNSGTLGFAVRKT